MAQDVAPRLERLLEQFLPVEPGAIESAFDDIWRDASSGALDSSSVRLRVSNVLAWGLEHDVGDRFEHLMDALAQQHPCRGILAVLGDGSTKVESAISAHCWRTAGGGRHICSEEVLLRSSPSKQAELASAVLALLVPELPVYAWLVGEPDPIRRMPDEILEVVDRLYLDSAAGSIVPESLAAIRAAASSDEMRVVDLAWQRSEPWRDVIAQFFDGRAAPLLDKLTSVEVVGGAVDVSSGALLIAGWLTSRLDLTVAAVEAANTGVLATFYDGSRPLLVRISPAVSGEELARVTLQAGDVTMSVELHRESGHMHVRSDWPEEPVHRTVATEPIDDAAVLTRALRDQEDHAIYADALRFAIPLCG